MSIKTNRSSRKFSTPQWALNKGIGFWELTFAGQTAIFKHEQGVFYVAYLLLHPPAEPIHGLALALRAQAVYSRSVAAAEIVDSVSGKAVLPPTDAFVQERSLGLDDARAAWTLRRKQQELEAILNDEDTAAPVKAEVQHELEGLYEYQARHPWRAGDAAQRASDAVAKAIKRFYSRLAAAVDASGRPHPVLVGFAAHLKNHLLIPSGRCCARGGPRPIEGRAGCFTYEPPEGVVWAG